MFCCFLQSFEISHTVLADGADIIGRQLLTFINKAADLADPTALGTLRHCCGQGLGLDVIEVVCIGHGRLGRQNLTLGNISDEQGVGAEVIGSDDLAGQNCIGAAGQIVQTVCAALQTLAACELIRIAAGLEAESAGRYPSVRLRSERKC